MAYVPLQLKFMQLLIEEIEKAYTVGGALKNESWEYICRRINIECAGGLGLYRVPDLKESLESMKKRYSYFSALLALDGVQWNMTTNTVKASRSTWRAYYLTHPDAPSYHHEGEKYFDLMCSILESGVSFD